MPTSCNLLPKSHLGPALTRLGRELRQRDRTMDVAAFRRLQFSTRIAEASGRLTLHFGGGPIAWVVGTLCLAYYFSVEAQLNHTVMHGAFRSMSGAPDLHPENYESFALPFQSRTWGDAHHIHHQNPSLLELDPDTTHPLFRVHPASPYRWWHRWNAFIGSLTTFECWSFDYDKFLKNKGQRSPSDQSEIRKLCLHILYQHLLFPLLSGSHWKYVLSGSLIAAVLRNFIFTALQTASSVGYQVSTGHAQQIPRKNQDAWFRFQIETSKNYELPKIWRAVFGGLDRHIEHHLYPDLPPTQLERISPEIRRLCRLHEISYLEFPSLRKSLQDSFAYLHALSGKGDDDSAQVNLKANVDDRRN